MPAATDYAYIASGQLHLVRHGEARVVASPFAEEVVERHRKQEESDAWKAGSSWGGDPMFGMMGFAPPPTVMPTVRSLDLSPEAMCYVVRTQHSSVLLRQQLADGYEQRLYHKQQFVGGDAAMNPAAGDDRVILSVADRETQTAHLAIVGNDHGGLKFVTDGDCIDEAASWVIDDGGKSDSIVYQSAGIGRDADGVFWALGPRRVEKLNLENGELDTLLDHDAYDYLMPRLFADDTLWTVRRPWRSREQASGWETGKAAVMAPWHFTKAVYTIATGLASLMKQEPPKRAGGPTAPEIPPALMLYGQLVATPKQQSHAMADDPPTAPSAWQLIKYDANDNETTVANGVVSYDVTPAGDCIYTDGHSIHRVSADGDKTLLHQAALVDCVRLLPG